MGMKGFAECSFHGLFLNRNMLRAYYLVLICVIAENSADGTTFVKLTRDDLKDIFPANFIFRKKMWDYQNSLFVTLFIHFFYKSGLTNVVIHCGVSYNTCTVDS